MTSQQTKLETLTGKLKILENTISQEEVGSVRHCILVSLRNDLLKEVESTKG